MSALYGELADWWPLISPVESHEEEAERILAWLDHPTSLLELGSGAGLLAANMPAVAELVLVDRSQAMLDVSAALNPGREHVCADMRTLELGRRFDAVLLHDAVMYLLDEDSLASTFAVAARHLNPGGRFVVLPDFVEDGFEEHLIGGSRAEGERSLSLTEWHWDPDPTDGTVRVDFSLLLREGDGMRSVHDVHTMALHPRARLWSLLRSAGFEPVEVPLDQLREEGELFLVRRADHG